MPARFLCRTTFGPCSLLPKRNVRFRNNSLFTIRTRFVILEVPTGDVRKQGEQTSARSGTLRDTTLALRYTPHAPSSTTAVHVLSPVRAKSYVAYRGTRLVHTRASSISRNVFYFPNPRRSPNSLPDSALPEMEPSRAITRRSSHSPSAYHKAEHVQTPSPALPFGQNALYPRHQATPAQCTTAQ